MAFDGIFLHQIVEQLQFLKGGRINKIYQISDTEVLFIIKAYKPVQLMVSTHSSYNRIHISNKDYPTRKNPTNFIMLLRKYLEGGFISSIYQVSLDRFMVIEVLSRSELGDKITLQLYVELMGKYANIILVKDGRIIDALKHIPPYENTIRTIQPGALFKETQPQKNRLDPFSLEQLPKNENLHTYLLGYSPLLSDEVIYRINNGQSFQSINQEILNSDKLYLSTINNEQFFHCLPLKHLNVPYESYEINEGLDYLYYIKEEKERIKNISGDLFKFTRKEVNKFTNKIDRLNQALIEENACDKYRYWGDLIYANLDKIVKGNSEVELVDFEDNKVTIPLDNKLDARGNAKKYFTKYRKLSTGQKYTLEQLEIAQDNLNYFISIGQQLEIADFATATEIKKELQQYGYLKAPRTRYPNKKVSEPSYTKISFENATILIGKNNIQNDFVTFKKAGRLDYWFHVKNMTGAHVILNSENPSESQIRFCAMLAAYFSKARESSSIPIDYTQVKFLKKIPNSKLGKVIMKEYKTIYIDIDLKLIEDYLK